MKKWAASMCGVDWNSLPDGVEIYALVLKENIQIQGLVGIKKDDVMKAAYLHWVCTAPWNNKPLFFDGGAASLGEVSKNFEAFSVRCLKDSE